MKNNKLYIFLVLLLCMISPIFMFGCGKYIQQFADPQIVDRYPPIGADGIGSNEVMWIKFDKEMAEGDMTSPEYESKVIYASDSTASREYKEIDPFPARWNENFDTLYVSQYSHIAKDGNRVHYISGSKAFKNTDDKYLGTGMTIWDFNVSGLSIISRIPTLDAIDIPNVAMTIEVIFNNSISSYSISSGASHDAGNITSSPATRLENSNTKLYIDNISWEGSPGKTVHITYEATDINGNRVKNGVLVKYTLQ